MKQLYRFSISSWILAVLPAVLLIWVLPDWFNPYAVKFVGVEPIQKFQSNIYADLNGDGESEFVCTGMYPGNAQFVAVQRSNRTLINEWDFNGEMVDPGNPLMIGDYDHDKISEVFVFTSRQDSIFAGYCIPFLQKDNRTREFFLGRFLVGGENMWSDVVPGGLSDLNGDGFDEYIFLIGAGFNLQPRTVFAIDLHNGIVKKTPLSGMQVTNMTIVDLNNDKKDEIVVSTYAPGNYSKKSDVQYHDSSAWVMVFTSELNYLFPPLEVPGRTSYVSLQPFKVHDSTIIVGIVSEYDGEVKRERLISFSVNGQIINEISLQTPREQSKLIFTSDKSHYPDLYFMAFSQAIITKYTSDLEVEKTISFQPGTMFQEIQHFDADLDGTPELFMSGFTKHGMRIVRNDFSSFVSIRVAGVLKNPILSIKHVKDKKPVLLISDGDTAFEYRYYKNPWYFLRFPFYLGLYLIIVLIIKLFMFIGRTQQKKTNAISEKILSLQTLVVQNQLEPHFILNALSNVGSLIKNGQTELASDQMINFSTLIRASLMDASGTTRSLEDEIQFVSAYLELQKSRLSNSFEYRIDIDDAVSLKSQVPKMMIQTYVENAVKHGLSPLASGGMLEISVKPFSIDRITIIIKDNGVGRAKAKEHINFSTGKGIMIMEQLYELFNLKNKHKIIHTITDLTDPDGKASGTRVEIVIPVIFEA